MMIVESISQWREIRASLTNQSIGFVPTMGYLHDGHLSLVKKAKEENQIVVLSIFVNPLQFGENEDFNIYPRDRERDTRLAKEAGVDYLFMPSQEEMYPAPIRTVVTVKEITSCMCGTSRPGHFDGVATVVAKLFNIIQPHRAYFGLKDAQQVAVISQMVSDLNLPVEIVPCPIVREEDGLALSSRNVYLSKEERKQATILYQTLEYAERLIEAGEKDVILLKEKLEEKLSQSPLAQIDYVEIREFPSLNALTSLDNGMKIIVALAVKIGKTRLIDNKIMEIKQGES